MLGTVTKALELDFCFEKSYCNCSANYHGLKKLLQLFSKLPWFDYHPANSARFPINFKQMRQIHLHVDYITISQNKSFTKNLLKITNANIQKSDIK